MAFYADDMMWATSHAETFEREIDCRGLDDLTAILTRKIVAVRLLDGFVLSYVHEYLIWPLRSTLSATSDAV